MNYLKISLPSDSTGRHEEIPKFYERAPVRALWMQFSGTGAGVEVCRVRAGALICEATFLRLDGPVFGEARGVDASPTEPQLLLRREPPPACRPTPSRVCIRMV